MVSHWIVRGRLREGVAPSRMGRHRAEMVRVVQGDEKKTKGQMEEMHQHKVAQMIKQCGRKRGTLAQDLQAHGMERRSTDPEE